MKQLQIAVLCIGIISISTACNDKATRFEQTSEERIAESKARGNTFQILSAEEKQTKEEAALAFQNAINRMGGKTKYLELLPEFNHLKTEFFKNADVQTKQTLFQFIKAHNLFLQVPQPVSQEMIEEAQKANKPVTVYSLIVTDLNKISVILDQFIAQSR